MFTSIYYRITGRSSTLDYRRVSKTCSDFPEPPTSKPNLAQHPSLSSSDQRASPDLRHERGCCTGRGSSAVAALSQQPRRIHKYKRPPTHSLSATHAHVCIYVRVSQSAGAARVRIWMGRGERKKKPRIGPWKPNELAIWLSVSRDESVHTVIIQKSYLLMRRGSIVLPCVCARVTLKSRLRYVRVLRVEV